MTTIEAIPQSESEKAEPVARNPLRWFVLAVVLAANTMDLMDATIVNVAGPSIRMRSAAAPPPCSG